MKLIAITGSIATGKSFVLELFKELGVPTFNCDEELREVMKNDADVIKQVGDRFPESIVERKINREILGDVIFGNASRRKELESILYPKLNIRRNEFIKNHASSAAIIVIEVPLLYEKKLEGGYDAVIVTTASKHIQERRAKSRGLTEDRLSLILANQLPDAIKVIRADHVVDTELDKPTILEQIRSIMLDIRACKQK